MNTNKSKDIQNHTLNNLKGNSQNYTHDNNFVDSNIDNLTSRKRSANLVSSNNVFDPRLVNNVKYIWHFKFILEKNY